MLMPGTSKHFAAALVPLVGAIAMITWLGGCATYTTEELPPPRPAVVPPPAQPVSVPTSAPKHVMASWYGPGFNGHLTSTGERYNENAMTAASRTLPIGSHVVVTNPKNGKSVEVRINDRGPHVRGRSLDLSKRAAQKLGITDKGVAHVVVKPVTTKSHAETTLVDGHSKGAPSPDTNGVVPAVAAPTAIPESHI